MVVLWKREEEKESELGVAKSKIFFFSGSQLLCAFVLPAGVGLGWQGGGGLLLLICNQPESNWQGVVVNSGSGCPAWACLPAACHWLGEQAH